MIPYEEIGAEYNYGRGKEHAKQVAKLALQFRDELVRLHMLSRSTSDEYIVKAAGFLHDIGVDSNAIGEGGHNERSYKTLVKELNPEELAKEETRIILDCILFHRNTLWRDWRRMTPKKSEHGMRLAAAFRIADALDRSLGQLVRGISLTRVGSKIVCEILPVKAGAIDVLERCEKPRASKKSDLFKDVFGQSIEFRVEGRN